MRKNFKSKKKKASDGIHKSYSLMETFIYTENTNKETGPGLAKHFTCFMKIFIVLYNKPKEISQILIFYFVYLIHYVYVNEHFFWIRAGLGLNIFFGLGRFQAGSGLNRKHFFRPGLTVLPENFKVSNLRRSFEDVSSDRSYYKWRLFAGIKS